MALKRILALTFAVTLLCMTLAADGLFVQTQGNHSLENYTYQSQLNIPTTEVDMTKDAIIQASGSADYPVTPGDVYTLTYFDGISAKSELIAIDSDYNAAIASLGNINAEGKKLIEFKREVEGLLASYYPYSVPQLTLKQCGVFSVYVTGEVNYTSYATVWGLSRLSDLVSYATKTASTREIIIKDKKGNTTSYDLYNGVINGSEKDNPLLTPGSEVIFKKAECTVSIDGAVTKNGVFQPKAGETLETLISSYAKGSSINADLSSVIISRYDNGSYTSVALPYEEAASYVLKDGDMFTLNTLSKRTSFVTVEGAVQGTDEKDTGRFYYSFGPEETAEELVVNIVSSFLGTSDPSEIYISRNGEKIAFDSAAALAGKPTTTTPLQQGDRVIVPYSQKVVTVTGGVNNPGTFAYIPDRTADYYINMAGGYAIDAKKLSQRVEDKNGDRLKKVEYIPAESTITVPVSHFRTDLSTAATFATLISTVLTIIVTSSGIINK